MMKEMVILKRPVITEKISHQTDKLGKYAFEVDGRSNKIEIKKAVEKRFGVEVINVRTMHVRGKMKRLGRFLGKTSTWKKAVVTLRKGQTIDYFENI